VIPGRRQALAAAGAAALALAARSAMPAERRIEVSARRYEFVPPEISVARGTRLTLAIKAEDFVHGFAMPDFGIRKDLVPGRVVEVTLTPEAAGRFHFLCDNFCGDGHDRMSGILVVS
jgi:cytochrome c oxidase subunit 2